MPKHTPGPRTYTYAEARRAFLRPGDRILPPVPPVDAAEIVDAEYRRVIDDLRSVNADLLAAAEYALDYVIAHEISVTAPAYEHICAKLRAAIARAKGEE